MQCQINKCPCWTVFLWHYLLANSWCQMIAVCGLQFVSLLCPYLDRNNNIDNIDFLQGHFGVCGCCAQCVRECDEFFSNLCMSPHSHNLFLQCKVVKMLLTCLLARYSLMILSQLVCVNNLMILHYTNYFPTWRSKGKRGNILTELQIEECTWNIRLRGLNDISRWHKPFQSAWHQSWQYVWLCSFICTDPWCREINQTL